MGAGLPDLLFPDVPLSLATLQIVFPYALGLAMVGLLETFLTQQLVDDITGTPSNMRREGCGQGIANLVTGFFGGMGGCAMIGQTMMNVKECGGRTRVSTFVAGLSLLVLVVFAAPVLAVIPMAALVAVMIMVSFATMNWASLAPKVIRRAPIGETATMVVTVAVVVATENLAYGVLVGVAFGLLAIPSSRAALRRRYSTKR
nr:SulP family inorganic anion transporter [Rhodococcus rhodnii]